MTDETKQAVVDEAKAPAQPAAAAQDARDEGDELDALLSQFDENGKPNNAPKPEPEPQAGTDTKTSRPDDDGSKAAVLQVQQFIFRQDMDKAVAAVRGDLDPEFFDTPFVKAWIDGRAIEDPRLGQAWLNRHANPKQFEKVVSALSRDFAKKYGKLPDKAATEDREAVTAAVRGASTKAPEGKAPDYSGMSNAEYRKSVKELYGYDPGV